MDFDPKLEDESVETQQRKMEQQEEQKMQAENPCAEDGTCPEGPHLMSSDETQNASQEIIGKVYDV